MPNDNDFSSMDNPSGGPAEAVYLHHRTGEQVDRASWRWEAYYRDGSILKQFDYLGDGRGEYHNFDEIDSSRLRLFKMVHDVHGPITLLFSPATMKLIHRYRTHGQVTQFINADGDTVVGNHLIKTSYFFGFEQNGLKTILFITPDNEVVVTDNPDKVQV